MLFFNRLLYRFCWLLALLPLWFLYFISDILFLIVYYVVRYRRKVVIDNLRNSFPEKTERERKQIARKFYRFLCDLSVETIKIINIDTPQIHRRINYSNPEILYDLHSKGKHVFVAIGHYGNWEWLATMEGTTPHHQATLYQPLQNKFFDKMIYDLRTKYGTDAIPVNSTVRAINKYIQENRLTILCFLSDQSPPANAVHHWTKFLNQDTAIYLGLEKLARRYNTAVLYYEIRRVKRGYYKIDITLIAENAAETAEMEITNRHVQLLEETIRRNPQYWLWSHRRWKHKRN